VTQPEETLPPITIAIVNYNGASYLPRCLDAIARQDDPAGPVLVVDTDSTDGSADRATGLPGVEVMKLGRNLGPGDARNAALRAAKTDLVLLLDNDVLVEGDCLRELLRSFRSMPGTIFAQARTVYDDQPDLVQCDGAMVHFLGAMILFHGHVPRSSVPAATFPIDSAITTALLVDRLKVLDAGGFDEDLFFYYEDHDWAIRMRLTGFPCLGSGAAVVRHLGGTKDLSFRTGRAYSSRRFHLLLRNRWIIILKVYPVPTIAALAPAFLLFEAFTFAYALASGFAGKYLEAVGYVATHLGQIARKRRQVAKTRRVDVNELLSAEPYPFHPGVMTKGWQKALMRFVDGATRSWWKIVRRVL
jgi:GT2 family glycosyltransferase